MWRIAVETPEHAVPALCAALEPLGATVSWFETESGAWLVEALADAEPDRAALGVAVAVAATSAGAEPPLAQVERVPETDWLAANQRDLPPIRVGRFFVHGSHVVDPVPAGCIGLRVDAATAFGSGHHGTTAGCLMAIDSLARQNVRAALDVGCGSGLLALAMAKLWRAPVVAADIDPVAVGVTAANAHCNGVAAKVRTICADGLAAPMVRARAPYDLIAANILARPLRLLAGGLCRHLAPGGHLILSGFVDTDGNRVLAAYQSHGLTLVRRITLEGWRTLVLRMPWEHG